MSEFNANPQRPQPSLPDPGQPEYGQPQFTPPRGFVAPGTPAWPSIPTAVRFAIWVWAISIIVSLAGVAVFAVLMVLGVAAGIGGIGS